MLSPEEDCEPWDDPWAVTWPEDKPAYLIPPDSFTFSEIHKLQDAMNRLAESEGYAHKIIVLPPGSKLT